MRFVTSLCLFFLLVACEKPISSSQNNLVETPTRLANSISISDDANDIWQKIGRAAQEMCRKETPASTHKSCQFDLVDEAAQTHAPNARSWIGSNGRSQISINTALYSRLKNADEHAFVLAHEAAHSIASHHRASGNLNLSSDLAIGRKADPTLELEADAIGTMLVIRAGFDPVKGSQILKRLYAKRRGATGTHPGLVKRLAIVKKTYEIIQKGGQIELD